MSEPAIREASCACGQLKIRLRGDPEYVSSCACQACQRRSGSAFAVTAYYAEGEVVAFEGEASLFQRLGGSGLPLVFRFCPDCGSTVWWEPKWRPGRIAVAAGGFADRTFPAPQRLIWTEHKASWVRPPEGAPEFPRAP